MAEPFEDCTGHIWKDEPIEPECTCFKKEGPTFQVDGSEGDTLKFATQSTPGAGYKLMRAQTEGGIVNNTQDLKLCRQKAYGLLRAGIKSTCGDVLIQVRFLLLGTYPVELPQTLVDWTINYKKKYKDKEATVIFPFNDSFTFNQRSFPPNVHPDMTITISDLTVPMIYTGEPCNREGNAWFATVSDNQATNDAGFQDPNTWDPSGATYSSESVHPDGHVGIDWRFYNTLVRFGDTITYGPTLSAQYILSTGAAPESDPYGFHTVSKTVSGPW